MGVRRDTEHALGLFQREFAELLAVNKDKNGRNIDETLASVDPSSLTLDEEALWREYEDIVKTLKVSVDALRSAPSDADTRKRVGETLNDLNEHIRPHDPKESDDEQPPSSLSDISKEFVKKAKGDSAKEKRAAFYVWLSNRLSSVSVNVPILLEDLQSPDTKYLEKDAKDIADDMTEELERIFSARMLAESSVG